MIEVRLATNTNSRQTKYLEEFNLSSIDMYLIEFAREHDNDFVNYYQVELINTSYQEPVTLMFCYYFVNQNDEVVLYGVAG